MVHKTWKQTEEKELIEEFKRLGCAQSALPQLAKRFNRSPEAIMKKLGRLGLNVVGAKIEVTTTIETQKVLPSLEEILQIIAGAIQKAREPGLGKTELQRLDVIVALSKEYREGLKEFVRYSEIEAKLVELTEKYERLAKEKTKDHASKPDPTKMVQASA